ncbi:MAG: class I SAM-dependent methyltransferase [Candidatus Diapherotrites archaeon]
MEESAYRELFEAENGNWWFLGRKGQVLMFLRKFLPEKKLKILDAGCGTGASIEFLKEFGEVTGMDISPKAMAFCKKKGLKNVSNGDIRNMPFRNNEFDLVVGLDVLEHVKENKKAISEFNRVLKDNGFLLLTVPAFDFLWTMRDEYMMHKKRFSRPELQKFLEKSGFKVIKISYRGLFYFFPLWIRILLFGTDIDDKNRNVIHTNWLLNTLFTFFLRIESFFMQFIDFPLGTAIIAIAQKTGG